VPTIEVFEGETDTPTFTAEFSFLPRVGEYLSRDIAGNFDYYNVVEVWHREDSRTGQFMACVRVQRDD
jgi:hypothetical protein